MGEEQRFLRQKTQAIFESEHTVADSQTGELLHHEHSSKTKTSSEPDYVKLYYKVMLAANQIEEIPLEFLLALSCEIGFSNGSNKVYFFNNGITRANICKICSIGDNMCSKYIKRCVEKGILFQTNVRGTYEVNPWMIAKGKWDNIKKLQAEFELINGIWKRTILEGEEDGSENTD